MISIRTFKKMIGFIACILVSTAFACAPLNPAQNDTQMSNSVTMQLEVNPIVRWTYHTTAARPGQPTSSSKAEAYVENDINQAIRLILADNKMDPNALTTVVTYTPQSCLLELPDGCTADTPDGCISTDQGTVTEKCPSTPLNEDITIKITAKIPVASSDWQRLAYKIREKLEAKNVLFEKDIALTF